MYQRLYVNIDHIATVRQARGGAEPDPLPAVQVCEMAGADGITAHLREDRRHINDDDIERISATVSTVFNFECAATDEMLDLAARLKPYAVTLVPERREEVTTEGGLDLVRGSQTIRRAIDKLKRAGVRASLFVDASLDSVQMSHDLGADAVELHTGPYSHSSTDSFSGKNTLMALQQAATAAAGLGLSVHAGHGLTARNVYEVSVIPEIEELNIGHSIISRAIYIGLHEAVREIRLIMNNARASLAGSQNTGTIS